MIVKRPSKIDIVRLFILLLGWVFTACFDDYHYRPAYNTPDIRQAKTKNVVVVVVDGLRYTEGWGDYTKVHIPFLAQKMAKYGVVNTRFYNNGGTYTSAGHANITTGIYRPLDNSGNELPAYPSVFQYWLKASGQPATKASLQAKTNWLFLAIQIILTGTTFIYLQ